MDPDAELKKQIDLAKENLIMLTALENQPSRRTQDIDDLFREHRKRAAQHTRWATDDEAALERHSRSMIGIDRKLKALIAAVKDLNSGKRPTESL